MRRIILPLLVLTILGACHKPNSLDGNLVKKPPMNTAGGVDAPGVDSGGGMNKPPKKPAVIEQPQLWIQVIHKFQKNQQKMVPMEVVLEEWVPDPEPSVPV